jgi:hypothetical protein
VKQMPFVYIPFSLSAPCTTHLCSCQSL